MRFLVTLSLILSTSVFAFSQSEEVIGLVKKGIQLHDQGKYEEAVSEYKKAAKLDEKSPLINYEIAYSYFALGDYSNTIKYSDKVLDVKGKYMDQAYIMKGSSYDEMKKHKKAIKTYEKGIKAFPENHMLRYNIALTYYREGEFQKTEEQLAEGINLNASHASSHLLLANLNLEQGKRVPAILGFYFFLLIEPDSERGKDALKRLEEQLNYGVEKKDDKNVEINLGLGDLEDEFSAINMLLSLKAAANIGEDNEGKTETELFIETTESLFSIMQEQSEGKTGIYWEFYGYIYGRILKSEHLEAFTYFILQSKGGDVTTWIEKNSNKVDDFFKWINE